MTKVMLREKILPITVGLLVVIIALGAYAFASQADASESDADGQWLTMLVGSELVDCVGVGPRQCLQVKFDTDDEWSLFYTGIAGFEYEPGFEYELLVEKIEIPDPPADASSIRYELGEVKDKRAATVEVDGAGSESPLTDSNWDLVEYGPAGGLRAPLPGALATIKFTADGIAGTTGCNQYFGAITLDGSALEVGMVGNTEMWCEGLMDQEAAILEMLGAASSYSLDGETLTIHGDEGDLLFKPAGALTLEGSQ